MRIILLTQELDERKTACERKVCKTSDRDNSNEIELIAIREKLLISQQTITQQEAHFKQELSILQSKNHFDLESERVKMCQFFYLIN